MKKLYYILLAGFIFLSFHSCIIDEEIARFPDTDEPEPPYIPDIPVPTDTMTICITHVTDTIPLPELKGVYADTLDVVRTKGQTVVTSVGTDWFVIEGLNNIESVVVIIKE